MDWRDKMILENFNSELHRIKKMMKLKIKVELEQLEKSTDRVFMKVGDKATVRLHYTNYRMSETLRGNEPVTIVEYISEKTREMKQRDADFNFNVQMGIQEAKRQLGLSGSDSLGLSIITDKGQGINF